MTHTLANSVAFTIGVFSHVLYFNRGEHHMYGWTYLSMFCVVTVSGALLIDSFSFSNPSTALYCSLCVTMIWYLGTLSSLIIYRVFFNPLNKFPGPYMARMTGFWQAFHNRHLNGCYRLADLHAEYGDFVRVGPSELSIAAASAVHVAYGHGTRVTKSDWYDRDFPRLSMHDTRDKGLHERRRRIFAPAFSEKAVGLYEKEVHGIADRVVARFGEFGAEGLDIGEWCSIFSWEVMGRLAFGKDYGMVEAAVKSAPIRLLAEAMTPLAWRLPSWFFQLVKRIPGVLRKYWPFLRFADQQLAERVERGRRNYGGNDIMTWVLKAYEGHESPEKDTLLQGDAKVVIVAGGDTTAIVLTFILFYLARDPRMGNKLREEIEPLTLSPTWSDQDIRKAPYLDAIIREGMRMHPPAPSGVSRKVPPEGMMVDETLVPGPDTTFWIPSHVVRRDERNFARGTEFIPERWLSGSTMNTRPEANAPFSLGEYSCLGKNLALMEMRILITKLIKAFDMRLAKGEDGHRLLFESIDHFALRPAECLVVFTPR